jgi:hypothetical protein
VLDGHLPELPEVLVSGVVLDDPRGYVAGPGAVGPGPPRGHLAEVEPRAHGLVKALGVHRFRASACRSFAGVI